MSVSYASFVQSHPDTQSSVSQTSFSWAHDSGATPKGILVFVFSISATAKDTSVTYGGQTLGLVTGGEANDTATEPGTVRTYFLGSGVPTGSNNVVVNRTNDATQMWAVSYVFNAATDTEVYGTTIQEENGTFAAISVNDGSPGSDSVRAAAGYSGGSNILTAATGSTVHGSNDLGAYTCTVCVEATPGQGARNVGFTYGTSDDRAYVALAIRELQPAPDTTPTLSAYGETSWTSVGTNKSTSAVSWLTGDKILILGSMEMGGSGYGVSVANQLGLTFTAGTPINDATHCWANSWIATATSDQTNVQIAATGANNYAAWGIGVWVFSGSNGFGNRASDSSTALTVSLTRAFPHSKVAGVFADYAAASPSGYSFAPSPPANDREASQVPTKYTIYVADWGDQGNAGSTNYGISGISGAGAISKIVFEVLGTYIGGALSIASGGPSLKKMSAGGTGTAISSASNGPVLKKMVAAGTGSGVSISSGGPTLKKMGVAGTGTKVSTASGGPSLKKMGISGSGTKVSTASGGPSLKKMGAGGSGSGITVATGISSLKKKSVGGTGTAISSASNGPTLKKMGVAGTGIEISTASGGPSLKKMSIAITASAFVSDYSEASGGPSLKKMAPAGSGSGITAASGGLSRVKMEAGGVVIAISSASGSAGLKKMTIEIEASAFVSGVADFSGGPSFKKMLISGTGTAISAASGGSSFKKMSIDIEVSAFSSEIAEFSGGANLKKMQTTGTGTGISSASGGSILKKILVSSSGGGIAVGSGGAGLRKMTMEGAGTGISEGSVRMEVPKMRIQGTSDVVIEPSDMYIFSLL